MSLKSHLSIKKSAQILGRRRKRLCVVAVNCLALLAFCKAITLLILPQEEAISNGILPVSFIALRSAPAFIKALTVDVLLCRDHAAICRGVLPSEILALGSAELPQDICY